MPTNAWMSSNFDQIRPLTTELDALERLKNCEKCCEHSSAVIFDLIFLKLAGNKDNHNISDEFENQQDPTYDYGVSCP